MKSLSIFALGLLICGGVLAQTATKAPLRTLIISGGPNVEYNQYAIESNARYLEKLTEKSSWRRVYFADGKPNSRTISTIVSTPATQTARALSVILGEDLPGDRVIAQPSALKRIDGSSTKPAVTNVLKAFAQPKANESGLLYFTGHGSAGGSEHRPDYINTTYALWDDNDISEREVASAINNWPATNPLFVVAVQCHSGGFANLIFQDGDPKKPLLNRDIAGFFSSTGQRVAAGCTSEVNERDYQDFTTHFFAALSGISRDGRAINGADYDHNGAVSGSEAFAYANINDLSIDVPVSTSDAYLRALYGQSEGWKSTSYSQILNGAQPWQKAMLNSLSGTLKLTGETRVKDALVAFAKSEDPGDDGLTIAQEKSLDARIAKLNSQLVQRYPGLKAQKKSEKYRVAKRSAQTWLAARPAEVSALNDAINKYSRAQNMGEVRKAMMERFVRGCYSVVLGQRVQNEGTPEHQTAFAKLRLAEARNPLK